MLIKEKNRDFTFNLFLIDKIFWKNTAYHIIINSISIC